MKNKIRRAGSKLRGQHKLLVHCTPKCEKLILEILLVIHTTERAVRGLVSHSPRLRALGKQDGPVLIRGHCLRRQECGVLKVYGGDKGLGAVGWQRAAGKCSEAEAGVWRGTESAVEAPSSVGLALPSQSIRKALSSAVYEPAVAQLQRN